MAVLADWILGLPAGVVLPQSGKLPRIISIGGGKGGVGKSIISANIAARMAKFKKKVLVIDLDLGCPNLHTYFGLQAVQGLSLNDYLADPNLRLSDVCQPTGIESTDMVAGGAFRSHLELATLMTTAKLTRLWTAVLNLKNEAQYDFVILDLGAGTMPHTMQAFSLAHTGLTTAFPEPTSVENAYVFLRSFVNQMIENVFRSLGASERGDELTLELRGLRLSSLQSYPSVFAEYAPQWPQEIRSLLAALESRPVGILLNQVRSQKDSDLGAAIQSLSRKYFAINSYYAGDLSSDDAAWKSLRNRKLLLNDFPQSPFAMGIHSICRKIVEHML